MTARGHTDYDVVVVGAGPAGACFATYLASAGRHVALLDAAHFPRDKPCGEGIMPAGVAVLRQLGVLDRLRAAGARPIAGVRYSLAGGASVRAGFPLSGASESYALGVRRTILDAALVERARSQCGVTLYEGRRITALARDAAVWHARTATGERFSTPLIIGADGYRSTVRRLLGWQRSRHGDRYGVVSHFRLAPGEPLCTSPDIHVTLRPGLESYAAPVAEEEWLVALLAGRAAMAPLAGDARRGYLELALSDPVIGPTLRAAQQNGPVTVCGPFDVGATRIIGDGALLIGDAAGFLDPITGEGIARSLRGARLAARVAQAALDAGQVGVARLAPYAVALAHLTVPTHRLTRLALHLCASDRLAVRALRGCERDTQLLPRLLGIGTGAWGFRKLTPRDWLALVAGV